MAQINLGNFGSAVPGRAPVVSQPSFGAGTAQAVERLGQTRAGIAIDLRASQTRLEQQDIERQRQQAEMAARAKESEALLQAESTLGDLHNTINDNILNGTLPRDQAVSTYREKAKETMDAASANFRPENLGLVSAKLKFLSDRLERGVNKAVEHRGRQEVTSSIDKSLEHFQRMYATDPQTATNMASATIKEMGPWSDMTPKQLDSALQGWKEKTQFTTGYEAVSLGRTNRKQLDRAEQIIKALPDLDPQKKAQLLDRSQAYRMHLDQQAELAAARADREAERRLRVAEAAFNAFQGLADKGTILDPTYIDQVSKLTAGTPYAAGIKQAAQQAVDAGGLARQPIPVQERALQQINTEIAQKGRSPVLDKRKEQVEKILNGSKGDAAKDPLVGALERGVITDIPPFDISRGLPGVVETLKARAAVADVAGRSWSGQPVSPLKSTEAPALAHLLTNLPADQRAGWLAGIASVLPPEQGQALALQLDKSNRPLALAMGLGVGKTTEGRYGAELLLRGAKVLEETKAGKIDAKGDSVHQQLRADVLKYLGDAVVGGAREDVIDAAFYIHAGLGEVGSMQTAKSAVSIAIGGTIEDHNGTRLPIPAGLGIVGLRNRLSTIPASAIAKQVPSGVIHTADGRKLTVDEFRAELPTAKLEPAGLGRYFVRSGAGVAVNDQGRPIVVDVR